jgi:4-hydroxy-tetrahydrodipicolinate reductase
MKIALFGHGKMGKMVEKIALEEGHSCVSLNEADVGIDFSHPEAVISHIQQAAEKKKPIVIGTTGWDSEIEMAKNLVEKSCMAALYSSNFSLGMAYFHLLLKQARSLFSDYDVAGVEYHHNQKKDSPSGTAKAIAKTLEMKTPFTSVRCGRITGKHEVIFDSPFDTVTLIHEAHGREAFARGALAAAQWLRDKKGWYTLDDLLRSSHGSHNPI